MRSIVPVGLAVAIACFCLQNADTKEISIGLDSQAQFNAAQVLAAPRPEIPPEHHENCFKSCCIAKFIIKADGSTEVKLMSSSGSEDIDQITLKTLKQWKFRPATLNGDPVESTKRVRIEFEVQ